jgi:hypothetical protein
MGSHVRVPRAGLFQGALVVRMARNLLWEQSKVTLLPKRGARQSGATTLMPKQVRRRRGGITTKAAALESEDSWTILERQQQQTQGLINALIDFVAKRGDPTAGMQTPPARRRYVTAKDVTSW